MKLEPVQPRKYKSFICQDKPCAPELKIGDKYKDGLTVKAGQPIKLEIPYRAIPAPEVTWLFNGKPIKDHKKTNVESGSKKSIVTVKDSTRADDKGEYTIKIKNDMGEETMSVNVNVIDKPEAPKEVRVQEITSKDAMVEWDEPADKGGVEILDFVVEICDEEEAPGRWKKVGKTKDKSMKVPNLKEDHEYKVRVSAENEMGTGPSKEVTKPFVAQDKPIPPEFKNIDEVKKGITVKAGETIKLEIPYRAIPAPEVTWTARGKPLVEDKRTKVDSNRHRTIMTVKDAIREDKGDFKLKLKNDEGEQSVTIPVNVIDKPKPPQDLKVANITADSVTLTWKKPEDDGGKEITGYIVDKRKKNADEWENVANTKELKTKVSDLVEGNEYNFRLRATNEVGESTPVRLTEHVLIKAPPAPPKIAMPEEYAQGITLNAGQDLKLEIPFTGNPVPEVTWTKDGKPLKPAKNLKIVNKDDETTVTLDVAKRPDKGEYKLKLKNELGEDSASVAITILDKPTKVKDLIVTDVTNKSVLLKWKKPEDDGGTSITAYVVEKKEVNATAWVRITMPKDSKVATETEMKFTVPDLAEDHEYLFRVSAENKIGRSDPLETKEGTITKKPPAPPKIDLPEDMKNGVTFHGGDTLLLEIPFTSYPPPEVTWFKDDKPMKPDKRIKIDVLEDKTVVSIDHEAVREDMGQYKLKVKNDLGEDTVNIPVTVIDVPKKPRNLQILDVQADNVTISWEPPVDDGGTDITGYIIEKNNIKEPKVWVKVSATKSLKFTVLNLIEGDEYHFRIFATNKIGPSEPLMTEKPVKCKRPKIPPKIELLNQYKDGVEVCAGEQLELEIPFSANPMPDVVWKKDGKPIKASNRVKMVTEEDKTVLTIPETERGDLGKYAVTLKNELGEDTAEIPVNVVDKPNPPRDLKVTDVREDQMTLSWKAPDDCNGAPLLGYTIEKQDQADGSWQNVGNLPADATNHIVPDLHEGHDYHFRVCALNRIGTSVPLQTKKAIKAERRPAPPDVDLDAKYLEPIVLRGGETLNIVIPYTGNPPPSVEWMFNNQPFKKDRETFMENEHSIAKLTVKEVRRDDMGSYKLRLKNDLGRKDVDIKVTVIDHPLAPRDLKVVNVLADSMVIRWREPEEDGGSPVTGYVIDKALEDKKKWEQVTVVDGATLTCKIPGLVEGTKYHYRVAARNDIGEGPHVVTEKATLASRPPAPPDVDLDAKYLQPIVLRRGDTLNIDIPYSGNPDPTVAWCHDNKPYKEDLRAHMKDDDSVAKLTVEDVRRNDSGTYTLKLKNDLGSKDVDIKVTVIDHPKPPRDLKVTNIMADSMVIRWREPEEDGGSPISAYAVEKCDISDMDNWEEVDVVDHLTVNCKIPNLTEGHEYNFRVRARNDIGDSDPITTDHPIKAERPPAPPDFDLDAKYAGTITLKGGETLDVEIPFSGKPDPTVRWNHNGKPLTMGSDDRLNLDDTDFVARLTVTNVNRNDSGPYVMKLSNELGTKDCHLRVKVIDKPDMPTNLKATNIMPDSITIRWQEPLDDGGAPVTGYLVEKAGVDKDDWEEVGITDSCNMKVPNLTEGQEYHFRVTAKNDIGDSDPLETTKPIKADSPPAAPDCYLDAKYMGVVTIRGGETLYLEVPFSGKPDPEVDWFHKGNPINEDGRTTIDNSEQVARLKVEDARLEDGGLYSLRLMNKLGSKDAQIKVKVIDVPKPPKDLRVTDVREDRMTLRWKEPESDCGCPITGYIVEYSGIDKDDWTVVGECTAMNFTVLHLIEGEEYFFKVRAVNEVGKGEPNETVQPVRAERPPAPPAAYIDNDTVTVEAGDDLVIEVPFDGFPIPEISWIINGHMVTAEDEGVITEITPDNVAVLSIPRVQKDDGGVFQIRLKNDLGRDQKSINVIVLGAPGRPEHLNPTDVTEDSVTLKWQRPRDNGGSPITSYVVEKRTHPDGEWEAVEATDETTFTVRELTEGNEYYFRVFAENKYGLGYPAETEEATLCKCPFEKPEYTLGAEYKKPVYVEKGGTLHLDIAFFGDPEPSASWNFKDLAKGRDHQLFTDHRTNIHQHYHIHPERAGYVATIIRNKMEKKDEGTYWLHLKNLAGEEAIPIEVLVMDVPLPPRDLKVVEVSAESMTVHWKPPEDDGGTELTGYIVEDKDNSRRTWRRVAVVPPEQYSAEIPNLIEGFLYLYRVFAENKMGLSEPCEMHRPVEAANDFIEPGQPSMPEVYDVRPTACELEWDPPSDDGGAPVTEYIVEGKLVTSTRWVKVNKNPVTEPNYSVKGLNEGADYEFRIVAVNKAGLGEPGPPSDIITAKSPYDPPGIPGSPDIISVHGDCVELEWTKPRRDGGKPITNYIIEMRPVMSRTWTKAKTGPIADTFCKVPNLETGGEFVFRVVAENEIGAGKPSQPTKSVLCGDGPQVIQELSDVNIAVGQKLLLKCKINGEPTPEIKWYKDGRELFDGRRFKLKYRDSIAQLMMDKVYDSEAGKYSCSGTNELGTAKTSCHVTVSAKPKKLLKRQNTMTIELDDFVEVDDDDYSRESPIHEEEEEEEELESGRGDVAFIKPVFKKKLSDINCSEGGAVKLTCVVSGVPRPEVVWLRNGQPIQDADDYRYIVDGESNSLIIKEVFPEDVGLYSVRASNVGGSVACDAMLTVDGEDEEDTNAPRFRKLMKDCEVCENESASFTVKISGRPQPEVSWFVNETMIVPDNRKYTVTDDGDMCTLTVNQCSMRDADNYACKAVNEAGEITCHADLIVNPAGRVRRRDEPEYPPEFLEEIEDETVVEGDEVTFTCSYRGNPDPDLQWFRNGRYLTPTKDLSIKVVGNRCTFIIREAFPEDSGTYTCQITNELGQATTSAMLLVEEEDDVRRPPKMAPSFSERFHDLEIYEGYEATFSCKIVGVPRPDVIWYFNNKKVDTTDPQFRFFQKGFRFQMSIPNASMNQSGEVVCKAKNSEGSDFCSAELIVHEGSGEKGKSAVPQFARKLKDSEVMEGAEGMLDVRVHPDFNLDELKIQWFKNGAEIYPDGHFEMLHDDTGQFSLLIHNATPADRGQYMCEVSNPAGKAACVADIVVDVVDQHGRLLRGHRVVDGEVKIRRATGDDDDYGRHRRVKFIEEPPATPNKPEVSNIRDTSCYLSWRALPYRAGENLTYTVEYRDANARNWRLLKQALTDPWLNVDILKPEFDYMFRIRAENMFGVSDPSPHASVRRSPSDLAHRKGDIPSYDRDIDYGWDVPPKPYVEGPPMFRGPDENMYVAEHQEAQLGMFVYGWPRPEVEWFFNGQPLQMGDKHKMHWESATSRQVLTVNDVLLEDIGTYMIVASNEYGKCARNIVVELAEPPCFIEPLKDKSIIERWGGRMDCRVDGIPYPEIKWFKDWHPITNSERIEITEVPPDNHGLTIRHAIMRDEGMYTCVAKNIAGEVHTHCSLTVEPEPLDYLGLDIELANKKVAPKKHKCNDFYDTVGDLGCGDFSEVKKVVERTSGREFAAKFYDTPDENKENAKHEIEVLGHLHHGNIPTLHDAFESQNAVVMVQELCDGGNVFDRLADKPSYTENEVALYLKQLLDAVKYMHSKHYVHLDLKPENLMFHHADSPELKLIDFGNARQLKPGEKVEVDRFNPEFVAPEILTGRNIGTGADMWSIGTIAYAMLTGLSPFLGDCDRDTINNVKHADWDFDPQAFRDVSDKAKDFINRLLVDAPELRMTAKDAAEHPFIRGLKSPDRGEKLDAEQLRNFQNRRKDLVDKTCVRVEPGHWDLDQKLSENAGYMLKHFPWSTAYTHGPDTTLVQLKDPQYTSRLRGYLEDTMWSWRWHSKGLYSEKARPSVHERRRILDIQDEAEDDRGVSTRVQISNLAMRRRLHGEGHAPVFREKLHDTSFRANVAVTLKCVVVGNPLPNVSWYRNDERLSMGGQDLDINLTIDGVATLLMPHPTQFAAGVYKVVARNSFGESTCWARLRLGETPDMPSRPQVVQIAPNEAFLEWDAPKFDGNSDIQTYRVDYRKPREERWTMASDTVEEEFTVVTGLIPNTPYRFRSCAKNQFGYGPYSFSSIEMRTPMPGEPKLKIERSKAHLIKEAMHRKSLSGMTTVAYDTEFTPVPLQEADPENNYVFRENIFVGRFCAVHKCIDSRDQTHRAAKIFPYTAGTRAIVLREFEAMRRLSHGNVVRLHEAFLTDDYAVLVLDKLEGGELLKCLCWHDEYTEELVAKIVRQLLDALQYLQYHGIVHLDLQPDNIMMVSRRLHTIKLADFGSARTLREPTLGDEDIDSDCPLEFMAPEVANYEAVSLQADVWGVGVLAFIMLSGVSPFLGEDDRETMDNISFVRYDYRDFYRNVTQEAFRFVQQLLRRNPMKRLTVEECLEHRWMQVTDVMTRQRESTSFFTNKLRIFAQEYNLCRKESATRNYDLLHAFGSLTRASSVDSVMSGFD
ncbi:PREDICTED: twitchin-like isoform X2 [Priapulus caudatus]|uniref:Twitchin-like isoform X2 n=1 Tax=Priapulus caudatus TaxID=37621 RepID=A0ABM1E668_PRICU|nr:PREDICTED: twitchin-like isoform X2 [Priapulus caudatus]